VKSKEAPPAVRFYRKKMGKRRGIGLIYCPYLPSICVYSPFTFPGTLLFSLSVMPLTFPCSQRRMTVLPVIKAAAPVKSTILPVVSKASNNG
jgi:hypothetical protein